MFTVVVMVNVRGSVVRKRRKCSINERFTRGGARSDDRGERSRYALRIFIQHWSSSGAREKFPSNANIIMHNIFLNIVTVRVFIRRFCV